jgi:glycerol-3-phosphate dehydrogenase
MDGERPGFLVGREEALARMAAEPLDVLVVGGGINGAGILRDLMLRSSGRVRAALVDKGHFSGGTSGRNSQLIHGGLRYLENLEFGLVREALAERRTLLRIAPGLVEPLPMIIPFHGLGRRLYYGTGLVFYDLLAGSDNVGRRRHVALDELARLEPGLSRDGLHSAAVFYDCKVNSARLVLANLFEASRNGALVANYASANAWRRDGEGFRVEIEDRLGGGRMEVRARQLVDARGPWEGGTNLRLVRGSHIVVPKLTRSAHAIAHFNRDGRILFIIPWGSRGDLSLVGTTDIDHQGGPDSVHISADEVRYLRAAAGALFPGADLDPVAAYSSLRPLVSEPGKSASSTSRSHRIWRDSDGVLKITGGKYTTYRAMAEQAVDLLRPELAGACATATTPLAAEPPPPGREAEVAVSREMARRLPDLMFVSTYLGHERRWTAEGLEGVARQMGGLLAWSEERIRQEVRLTMSIAGLPE